MPLDIAFGILGAVIISRITGAVLGWPLIAASIIFALLPDFNFLPDYIENRGGSKFSHEHRDLLHNPIPYLLIGFVLLSLWNVWIAVLFAALGLCHFLHDSVGIGWGVRWAYPFSKKYYKFFSDKDGRLSKNLVASWTPEEQKEAATKYGDPRWLSRYFRSGTFFFELLALLATFLVLWLQLRG